MSRIVGTRQSASSLGPVRVVFYRQRTTSYSILCVRVNYVSSLVFAYRLSCFVACINIVFIAHSWSSVMYQSSESGTRAIV